MRFLLLLAALIAPLLASTPHTPEAGSPERQAILDAVRDPVEDILHQSVSLKVNHLKVQDDWAFLDALPHTPGGDPVNYEGTMFEEWVGEADEVLWVLLRHKRGRWYVVTKVFFTTEMTWAEWPKYFRAPRAIFPASPVADKG